MGLRIRDGTAAIEIEVVDLLELLLVVTDHLAQYPRNHILNILTISFSYRYLQIVSNCVLKLLNMTSQTAILLSI